MSFPVSFDTIRSWEPCYDPTVVFQSDPVQSIDDVLNNEPAAFTDKIWFLFRHEFLIDEQMEQFINDVGPIEGEFENLRVKAMEASKQAVARAFRNAAPGDPANNPAPELRLAAQEAELQRQFALLSTLVNNL